MFLHTGERPYSCASCDLAFTGKDRLNEHVKKVHPHMAAGRQMGIAPKPDSTSNAVQPTAVSVSNAVKSKRTRKTRSRRLAPQPLPTVCQLQPGTTVLEPTLTSQQPHYSFAIAAQPAAPTYTAACINGQTILLMDQPAIFNPAAAPVFSILPSGGQQSIEQQQQHPIFLPPQTALNDCVISAAPALTAAPAVIPTVPTPAATPKQPIEIEIIDVEEDDEAAKESGGKDCDALEIAMRESEIACCDENENAIKEDSSRNDGNSNQEKTTAPSEEANSNRGGEPETPSDSPAAAAASDQEKAVDGMEQKFPPSSEECGEGCKEEEPSTVASESRALEEEADKTTTVDIVRGEGEDSELKERTAVDKSGDHHLKSLSERLLQIARKSGNGDGDERKKQQQDSFSCDRCGKRYKFLNFLEVHQRRPCK